MQIEDEDEHAMLEEFKVLPEPLTNFRKDVLGDKVV